MKRIRSGVGHLPRVELRPEQDGKLGQAAIQRLAAVINEVIGVLNGRLRLGTGDANTEAGNLDGITLHVTFSSTPDTEVTIPHDLGRVPRFAHVVWADRACRVYSSRGASRAWGDLDKAYFTCDTASATCIILLS